MKDLVIIPQIFLGMCFAMTLAFVATVMVSIARRHLAETARIAAKRTCRFLLWRRHEWVYDRQQFAFHGDVVTRECADCCRKEELIGNVYCLTDLGDENR